MAHRGGDKYTSKGLEFALLVIPGVGQMPAAGADEHEEARLFQVAAPRATHRLVNSRS